MSCRIQSNSDSESSNSGSTGSSSQTPREGRGVWTDDEHERFLVATSLFPHGPWRAIAEYVGTRTVRQTMTHAQKLLQRQARHERGLKQPGRVPAPNSRRRRRKSRRRQVTATALVEIPVDAELEMLFAPPPPQAMVLSMSGALSDGLNALHVGDNPLPTRLHVVDKDEKEDSVAGIGSVSNWLAEFLQSVDLSDLEFDDDEEGEEEIEA